MYVTLFIYLGLYLYEVYVNLEHLFEHLFGGQSTHAVLCLKMKVSGQSNSSIST